MVAVGGSEGISGVGVPQVGGLGSRLVGVLCRLWGWFRLATLSSCCCVKGEVTEGCCG